ncbi:FtsX-like permease family protein [Lactobacillus sp. PV034]|uniref:FtsX-like permease family protein n=1 Tax=Lactobacillus sp. PV034 TaxID=2594495 RepID=UPI0022407FEC|nr:FtsX-like permease family protein [Lactobacillus sp. PV034]QNQ81292.1 FtsX-like permease family protein [Lactobacillus sp. PV034]
MLWKLSLTSIKSRWKDYLVLFSGLTLASAIFYMFMTLATNPSFLKGNVALAFSTTQAVYGFGIVLLALITFIYIIYANSFLLSMRQKDYAMYMMLGARSSKIGRLIFVETFIVGTLATIIGEIIGIGLTQLISQLIITQLGLAINHFVGFYVPALLWTLAFFIALFFLAALWNRHKLVKANLINLLKEDQKPIKTKRNTAIKIIEAILGVSFLATGYWAMAHASLLVLASIPIAFVTIVLGSYFIFDSLFTLLIDLLRKNKKFKYAKLHSFTLGQLKFRINSYNRILSITSLLFALALGAITVGLNFKQLTDQQMESTYYDVVLFNQNKKTDQQLKKITVTSTTKVKYKIAGNYAYVSANQIKNAHLKRNAFVGKTDEIKYRTETIKPNEIKAGSRTYTEFAEYIPYEKEIKVVSQAEFDQIKQPSNTTILLRVKDFQKNFNNVEKLQKLALPQNKNVEVQLNSSKAASYRLILNLASGFEFMGFFLGIAFLAMLASTLMFKVLSGAKSDGPRYIMLWKMGTRTSLLKTSIDLEIGILFILPAILGILDVLFGLQFFKALLAHPYDKIWIPFGIFLIFYLVYYLITVKLYQSIVLKKIK